MGFFSIYLPEEVPSQTLGWRGALPNIGLKIFLVNSVKMSSVKTLLMLGVWLFQQHHHFIILIHLHRAITWTKADEKIHLTSIKIHKENAYRFWKYCYKMSAILFRIQ